MSSMVSAKNLERASQLSNLPIMDPEDASYTMKTKALLALIGINIETDAYFDDDGEVPLETLRSENGSVDLRQLKQLKVLVASQMSDDLKERAEITGTGFGLYCYYGCHCLTDADHVSEEHGLVGGQTIDDIDSTCKQMGVCYRCLRNKYQDENGNSTCDPETTRYRFSFFPDGTVDCSSNRDPCKRDTCMCDKDFAEGVAQHDHQWDPSNHVTRGGFNRHETCQMAPARSGAPFETCCGMDSFPMVGYKKQGHDACCGNNGQYAVGYDSSSETCCEDGTVVPGRQVC